MFPPNVGEKYLNPSRVPFEESSVYSRLKVSPFRGDDLRVLLKSHVHYKRMVEDGVNPWVVVLEPGDALYVPRHWWHFVASISEDITVTLNTWIETVRWREKFQHAGYGRALLLGLDVYGHTTLNTPVLI